MGSLTALGLECRSSSRATSACTSASFPLAEDPTTRMRRLEDCLNALKEERRKIEAFQRELPLCMQLLHDAIESYNDKLAACKSPSMEKWHPVQSTTSLNETASSLLTPKERIGIEESNSMNKTAKLYPNCNIEDEPPNSSICKPEWMALPVCSTVQGDSMKHPHKACPEVTQPEKYQTDVISKLTGLHPNNEHTFSASSKPYFHSKNKSGGAFTPFSREKQAVRSSVQVGTNNSVNLGISLKDQDASSTPALQPSICVPSLSKVKQEEPRSKSSTGKGNSAHSDNPSQRKARRCWSPELHRRFVNALQQLGGSQVATPKQIREVMKVEGLTNDEVKSHLQKYRLHTRRLSPPQSASPQTPQVVVLGGIWVPPDYTVHTTAQQGPNMFESSHQSHVYQAASPQELCSEFRSAEQMHLQPSSFHGPKLAPAHSQSSPHGASQLAGHSAALHNIGETGRDGGVCDDEGSNNSSCKGCPRVIQSYEACEMEDNRSQGDSISGFHSHCTSEDEDNHGSDTSLKMV
ncbi:hypothetical protein KP509_16G011700 [Ceratopteris richardii]|uniref:HTH myb-type domain-containing protein n=1 Tax=Ceratopteris richardii TaxID=49495 RepID=A0A8T2SYQ8_CERRI|nr:hypothetical protein KP509_16G011700 [Ceratopteris richardii]